MQIIETDLKFSSLSARSATRRIIVHNADASSCTAEQIHSWHKANGWSGAGYHFLVRKDGSVYRLRAEYAIGAHASGANSDSLGICFEGRYNTETMPAAQMKAGQELLAHLKAKYGISLVQPHRDVTPTDCPGKVFPWAELVSGTPKDDKYEGWVHDTKGWWWRWSDGSYAKAQWQQRDGSWYWFDDDGYAATRWRQLLDKDGNVRWYWFRPEDDAKQCAMVSGTCLQIESNWYAFAEDGHMIEGAVHVDEWGHLQLD